MSSSRLPTCKTDDLKEYVQYLEYVCGQNDAKIDRWLNHSRYNRSREWKFEVFQAKVKFFEKVFNCVKEKYLGIGNWKHKRLSQSFGNFNLEFGTLV